MPVLIKIGHQQHNTQKHAYIQHASRTSFAK